MVEKRGAGGNGLRGLPPYLDDGVPGRGLPLRSDGSYEMLDGGGRERSDCEKSDIRDEGVQGLIGELLPLRLANGTYDESGGAIDGISSRIEEPVLDWEDLTLDW